MILACLGVHDPMTQRVSCIRTWWRFDFTDISLDRLRIRCDGRRGPTEYVDIYSVQTIDLGGSG